MLSLKHKMLCGYTPLDNTHCIDDYPSRFIESVQKNRPRNSLALENNRQKKLTLHKIHMEV